MSCAQCWVHGLKVPDSSGPSPCRVGSSCVVPCKRHHHKKKRLEAQEVHMEKDLELVKLEFEL